MFPDVPFCSRNPNFGHFLCITNLKSCASSFHEQALRCSHMLPYAPFCSRMLPKTGISDVFFGLYT